MQTSSNCLLKPDLPLVIKVGVDTAARRFFLPTAEGRKILLVCWFIHDTEVLDRQESV